MTDEDPETRARDDVRLVRAKRARIQHRAGRRPTANLDVRAGSGEAQAAGRGYGRQDGRRRRRATTELPRGDDERGEHADANEREHDRAPLEAHVARTAPRGAGGCVVEPVGDEARIVLVDVDLPVEAEE